ncbi:MAG: T9SS type A sorting domain-containing protein [Bacteroidales bacterium]|jgi:hypothetical protein
MKRIVLTISIALLITHCLSGQWNANPEENLVLRSGIMTSVKSVKTTHDRLFVSWFYQSGDNNNYNLYVQLLDVDGKNLWDVNGLLISSHPQGSNAEEQVMLSDDEGNLVIVFSDFRDNGKQGLVCYKLNQEGESLWGNDGVSIMETMADNWITRISASYNSENEIIVSAGWYGESIGSFFQRITPDKTLPWGIQGKSIPNAERAQVFSTGENIVLLFTKKTGTYPDYDINLLYQLFDKEGNAIFQDDKTVSDAGGIVFWDQYDALITDTREVVVTWHDDRDHDGLEISYAQRIDGAGNTLWEDNGIALTSEPAIHHFYPRVVGQASDSSTIIIWQRTQDPAQWRKTIFGQKVERNGKIAWGTTGKALFADSTDFHRIEASVMDHDNFYIAFGVYPALGFNDIVHYYMGSYTVEKGEANWTHPVSFATSAKPKSFFKVGLFPDKQIVATWLEGDPTPNQEVRGQNIALDGSLGIVASVLDTDESILTSYPNPSGNFLQLNYAGADIESVMIINMLGVTVYNQLLNSLNPMINVSDLKPGVYFIKVHAKDNKTVSSKFVKIC